MKFIGQILSRLLDAAQISSGLLILAMMFHVSIDALSRYIGMIGIPATVEVVSHYYMVGIAFLPLAYAEKMRAHISVEVATQLLPTRLQNAVVYLSWLLSIVVYATLCYRTFLDAESKRAVGAFIFTQNVRVEIWPTYYFLPLGFALMVLTLVYRCVVFFVPSQDSLVGDKTEGHPQ